MYLVLQFYHFMLLRGVTQCNKSKQLPLTYSTTYSKWNKLGFLPSFSKMALRMKNVTFLPKMCLKQQAMTFLCIYTFFLPHYPIVYKFSKKYIEKQAQKSGFFHFWQKMQCPTDCQSFMNTSLGKMDIIVDARILSI